MTVAPSPSINAFTSGVCSRIAAMISGVEAPGSRSGFDRSNFSYRLGSFGARSGGRLIRPGRREFRRLDLKLHPDTSIQQPGEAVAHQVFFPVAIQHFDECFVLRAISDHRPLIVDCDKLARGKQRHECRAVSGHGAEQRFPEFRNRFRRDCFHIWNFSGL